MSSTHIYVSLIDYTFCTEESGVEVKFSEDYNFLHFSGKKVNGCDIRCKQANSVKVRLNIADVIAILIGP